MATIVVLEDEPRRSNEMGRVIAGSPLPFDVLFFDNAHEMLKWLASNVSCVAAASLDYDLDTTTVRNGVDAGTGGDVAEYLTSGRQRFPVLIHSSNALRAPGMHMSFALAGWPDLSLFPYTDAESWLGTLLSMVNGKTA